MKVLGFIGAMTADGAERVMSLMLNTLASKGHKVTLLLHSNIIEYKLHENIKVKVIGNNRSNNRIVAALQLLQRTRKVFKEEKPDVIVAFMSVPSMYACICSLGLNIPVVISERNTPSHEVSSKFHSVVRNICYRFADGAIFQTADARDYFSSHIRKNSTIIPNPVSDDLPYADRENVNKEIVTLGRLQPQKNHAMLLDAFAMFLKAHPDYHLNIFGRGNQLDSLKSRSEDLKIDNNVHFLGSKPNIHQEIKNASMYVLSSNYEGISNALMECMAMGLPCVSTDCPCGGSRSLITSGENGILTPVGDAAAFCKAMSKIADDKDFADSIGEKATAIRETHSREKIIGKYIEYLEKCSRK